MAGRNFTPPKNHNQTELILVVIVITKPTKILTLTGRSREVKIPNNQNRKEKIPPKTKVKKLVIPLLGIVYQMIQANFLDRKYLVTEVTETNQFT